VEVQDLSQPGSPPVTPLIVVEIQPFGLGRGQAEGRGGADDGYAALASLAAIEAVQRAGGSHGRCFVLIEACEESGSPDLPAHIEALTDRLGPSTSSSASTPVVPTTRPCG
jgi:acetylornithine deacetylase/succinyl-diaminopimelate desuccinylase-like protein